MFNLIKTSLYFLLGVILFIITLLFTGPFISVFFIASFLLNHIYMFFVKLGMKGFNLSTELFNTTINLLKTEKPSNQYINKIFKDKEIFGENKN